jgi:hypothetical protein
MVTTILLDDEQVVEGVFRQVLQYHTPHHGRRLSSAVDNVGKVSAGKADHFGQVTLGQVLPAQSNLKRIAVYLYPNHRDTPAHNLFTVVY